MDRGSQKPENGGRSFVTVAPLVRFFTSIGGSILYNSQLLQEFVALNLSFRICIGLISSLVVFVFIIVFGRKETKKTKMDSKISHGGYSTRKLQWTRPRDTRGVKTKVVDQTEIEDPRIKNGYHL